MATSKKIFALLSVCFVGFLAYIAYDISSNTTFPGSHKAHQNPKLSDEQDSIRLDSLR